MPCIATGVMEREQHAPSAATAAAAAAPAGPPTPRPRGPDRRDRPAAGRRGRRGPTLFGSLWKDVAAAVLLVSAIYASVGTVKPIFARRERLAERVVSRVPAAKVVIPVDTSVEARIVAGEQFEKDRRAFSEDLMRTGRISQARADSIAYYAVREAHRRGIPPALIFGVMLTENSRFISDAKSNVGATGLMQIYPKVWLKPLGGILGRDLAADSTNMKYGAFILAEYLKPRRGESMATAAVRKGLLRYNGCVRGTNTPRCHTYPDKVERYVEREGLSLCAGKSFYDCIAKPFMVGLVGE